MVIIFSDARASIAASVYAVASAIHNSLKTVILQFDARLPAEDILIGKRKNDVGACDGISNTGMDALVRYQSFSSLTKEHFNMCVTPLLKTGNLLDLVAAPLIEDFSKKLPSDLEKMSEIITVAESVYDNVLLVLDRADSELTEAVRMALGTHEYKLVRGLRQGTKGFKSEVSVNEYFLIHDYDADSFFTLKYYKKLLGSANVSAFPYNVSFRDACLSGDLLMFLRKNLAVDSIKRKDARKEDVNAELIMQFLDFLGKLNYKRDEPFIEKADYEDMHWEHKQTMRAGNEKRVIDGRNVFMKEQGGIIKSTVVTICTDRESDEKPAEVHSDRVSNYMYKTSRTTFDRLLNIAKRHKRSVNAELNHIVNNYIYYMESNAALDKRNEFSKAAPARKALIS